MMPKESMLGQDKSIDIEAGDMSLKFQVCFPWSPVSLKTIRESNLRVRLQKGNMEV